jgi:hypothetical protein
MIGVCGEQGSGKTVFLTCIFQSIGTAFPDDVIVSFDRGTQGKSGNANSFQSIEDQLIAKGPAQGTTERTLFPARIYVKSYQATPGAPRSVLSVDILDFAGRHFRSMADLRNLAEPGDSDPEYVKALREVNETLEKADAFIILINSTEIDPLDETLKRNPFSPSVNFMLAHCRDERKPVALLFSQIDQTPRLTEELFRTKLLKVQQFERQFTPDLKESLKPGGRPFGIARRISCYETLPGDLAPRRQTLDSIWRREPAEVVLELLRAVMPQINRKLEEKKRKAEEDEREKERKERSQRKRQWALRIAALLVVLTALGVLSFAWYKQTEGHQVHLLENVEDDLRQGRIASISPTDEAMLGQILRDDRKDPSYTPSGVQAAIQNLDAALAEAAQRLAGKPALAVPYTAEIARFQSLVPLFDPVVTAPWGQTLLPLLARRDEFLSDWFGTERKERRARTSFLDEAAKRFADTGDHAFAALLAAQSTQEKMAEVASWQTRIDADADVPSRLATIQSLLASTVVEQDTEFLQLARTALVGDLVATILKRQENGFLRDKVLTPLAPDLAKLGDGEVRFEVLARVLLECDTAENCEQFQGVIQSALADARTAASAWSSGVENLLRSLLLDLPPEGRSKIWSALAAALSSGYLFSSREDAWPAGAHPLASAVLSAVNGDSDATDDLIERFAHHPIYEGELVYLNDRLTALALSRQVVPIYSTLLTGLGEKEAVLQTGSLTTVDRQVSEALADRAEGPLAAIKSEIEQALKLAQSINEQRARGGFGDPSAGSRLERLLHEARRGHCAALEGHGAPTKCADAA